MRIQLLVQGEGRGHMTQAIAFQQWCHRHHHRVVSVLAGQNHSRTLPRFFQDGFDVPVRTVPSPGLAYRHGRSVSLGTTVWRFLTQAPRFRSSLQSIAQEARETQADLIVSFLEPLAGYLGRFDRETIPPIVSVGHQFMLAHPIYHTPGERRLQQLYLKAYVHLAGRNSTRYALSFYSAPNLEARNLFVGPPLLRQEVANLREGASEGFILVYLLNHGYRRDIEAWKAANPQEQIHCFYDRPGAPEVETPAPGLTFHCLNGTKFLQYMARARAVVCTAGFESVSEAASLCKPALLVPAEGHIEQYINALDAQAAGLGRYSPTFDLSRLKEIQLNRAHTRFQTWLDASDQRLGMAITAAVAGRRRRHEQARFEPSRTSPAGQL